MSSSLEAILGEHRKIPAAQAQVLVRQLLEQLSRLHARGRVHRGIGLAAVRLTRARTATLTDPEPVCELGGRSGDPERCPPEWGRAGAVLVPADLATARQVLADAGLALDPRRLDVYQVGTLLCRLLTGQPVRAYLRSPQVKATVPAPLRPVLEGALGYDPARRFGDCEAFLAALDAVAASQQATETWEPPASLAPGARATPPVSKAEPAFPFQQLGHYRIERRLGQGGMGDVYLGFEEALQRRVALKVLPATLARDPDFVRRFQTEATAAARLAHPNLVPVYFIGTDAGHHFFAMQYVEGESLAQRLAQRGRLPVEEAVAILENCLEGLEEAHQAGLVHRDIKPGNILLDAETGRALVADFGLVKSATVGQAMTATGLILGTADYLAPEQARGRPVDGRTDLYALGVVAYQMLSGRLPFQAETPQALVFQHVHKPAPPLRQSAPEVPAPLAALVDKLLAKDPAARYQRAAEVLTALRRWQFGDAVAASPAGGHAPGAHDLALPEEERVLATPGLWQRLREKALDLVRAQAPGFLEQLQNTEQQVDGAVAEYQRRRDELARLVAEAEEVARELSRQAGSQAPSAPQENEQIAARAAEAQEQLRQLRLHLAQVEATLGCLRSQRDLLRARLRVANEQRQRLGGEDRARRVSRRRLAVAVLLGLLLLGGIAFGALRLAHQAGSQAHNGSPSFATETSKPGADETPEEVDPERPLPVFRELRRFMGEVVQPGSFCFLPDGHRALGLGLEGITLWNADTGQVLRKIPVPLAGGFRMGCPSPDGRFAYLAGIDRWVWRYNLETEQVQRLFSLKETDPMALTVSADGRLLLVGCGSHPSKNGQPNPVSCGVRVWNLLDQREVLRFEGHNQPVGQVSISGDGERALSVSQEAVCLWEVKTGKLIRSLGQSLRPKPNMIVSGVLFADGRRALLSSHFADVFIWDVEADQVLQTLTTTGEEVVGVAATQDGRRVLTATQRVEMVNGQPPNIEGHLHLWSTTTGQELRRFARHTDRITRFALAPDGRMALTSSLDQTVRLWDLKAGLDLAYQAPPPSAGPTIPGSASAPSGAPNRPLANPAHLAVGELRRLADDFAVQALSVSRDGRQALGVDGSRLRIWDLETGKVLHQVTPTPQGFYGAAFSPDGQRAYLTTMDAWIWTYDLQTRVFATLLESGPAKTQAIAVTSDGLLLTANGDMVKEGGKMVLENGHPVWRECQVKVWDPKTGKQVASFHGHREPVLCLSLSSDGKVALSVGFDALYLWDVRSGQLIRRLAAGKLRGVGLGLLFPNGQQALLRGIDNHIHIWDVENDRDLYTLPSPTDTRSQLIKVALSPDGLRILTSTIVVELQDRMPVVRECQIHLCDVQSGQELRRFEEHPASILHLLFAGNGLQGLSGSQDGTVRLWDLNAGLPNGPKVAPPPERGSPSP